MLSRVFLALTALTLSVASLRADLIKDVSATERQQLTSGQTVVQSENVAGSAWPRLSLFRIVNAPPSVVWNLFNDYSAATSYTPGLIEANVIKTYPDGSKDVRYTVKAPIIQRVTYTVHNTYKTKSNMQEVKWEMTQPTALVKSSDGSLRIQPYGQNQTLMCYSNLCVPISGLLAGLKNEALREAQQTVTAIATEAAKRAGN